MSDETETAAFVAAVQELLKQLHPLLAGHPPPVQGAALADCLALWLAGHHIQGDAGETAQLREYLLEQHLVAVRGLVEPNARQMGTWIDPDAADE